MPLAQPCPSCQQIPHRSVAVDIWVSRALRKAVSCIHKLCNCTGEAQEREKIQSAIYDGSRGREKINNPYSEDSIFQFFRDGL